MVVSRISSQVPYDSNIYLIKGDASILVDTGSGTGSRYIMNGIREILKGDSLDMVILTHCHADHVGGLKDIMSEFHCPAYSGKDAEFIRTASPYALGDMMGLELEPVEVTELSEGETIDVRDHRLRVIYTPGHTSGGISLYDEVTESLFSGDTLFTMGVGRTDFPTGSSKDLIDSLLKLSKLEIKSLYPGHGNGSEEGNQMVTYGLHMMGVSYERNEM